MGYIKLFRKMQEWGWYDDPNTLALWVHLLLDANWKECAEWHGVNIERGSMITSVARLSTDSGLSERQVRTCLWHLVKTGEIKMEATNKWTKITICKYDSYQGGTGDECQADDKQPTSNRQTTGEQPTTIEEGKKAIKEEGNKKKKTSNDVKETLSFPFSSDAFMLAWGKLVKEPKWKSKTVNALQLSLNKLGKYDERFAIKLMEDAIEHGWQGVVFKDTDAQYAEWMAANPPMPKQQEEEPTIQFNTSPWEHGVFYTIADFQATEEGRKLLESFRGEWMETVLEEEGGLLRFRTIWEPLSDHPEFAEQNKGKLK